MPPDPAVVVEVRSWLAKAAKDLETGESEIRSDHPFAEGVLFHPRQAVEKSLKAFLSWHLQPFRHTHNLVELGASCVLIDPSLDGLLRQAVPLSEDAWKFRFSRPAPDEAAEALALATAVFRGILERLPADVRP